MNEVDSDATGELHFPNFLQLMRKKYSDNNAEDEIREAFRVFDSVSGKGNEMSNSVTLFNMPKKMKTGAICRVFSLHYKG